MFIEIQQKTRNTNMDYIMNIIHLIQKGGKEMKDVILTIQQHTFHASV